MWEPGPAITDKYTSLPGPLLTPTPTDGTVVILGTTSTSLSPQGRKTSRPLRSQEVLCLSLQEVQSLKNGGTSPKNKWQCSSHLSSSHVPKIPALYINKINKIISLIEKSIPFPNVNLRDLVWDITDKLEGSLSILWSDLLQSVLGLHFIINMIYILTCSQS